LSGGVYLYNSISAATNREIERLKTIERLDYEIAFRYSQMIQALSDIEEGFIFANDDIIKLNTEQEKRRPTIAAIRRVNTSDSKSFITLYPEYRDWSLVSLHAELHRNLPPKERKELEPYIAALGGNVFSKVDLANRTAIAQLIRNRFVSLRW